MRHLLIVLGLTALASPAWAQAVNNTRAYTVREGDTCIRIAQRQLGSARGIEAIHRLNNLGPTPHRLRAGAVLQLPLSVRDEVVPAARLTSLHNRVESYTPERHDGRLNEALERGHRVNTHAESGAAVTFLDESRISLEEQTLVVIFGENATAASLRSQPDQATLLTGALRTHLGALVGRPPARIATPGSTIDTAGDSRISVDSARMTRLASHRGQSNMVARRRRVTVPEGFGVRVREGERPGPVRPLPLAPRFEGDASPPQIVGPEQSGRLDFGWVPEAREGVPAPSEWRVQLARDPSFVNLALDLRQPAATPRVTRDGLSPGDYYLRVIAVDAEGMESVPSTVRQLRLRAFALGPAVSSSGTSTLRAPEGFGCRIAGTREAFSASIEVPRRVQTGVECAPEGSTEVSNTVTLEATLPPEVPPPPPVVVEAPPPPPPPPPPLPPRVRGTLGLEAGAVLMLGDYQRDVQGYNLGAGARLVGALRLVGPVFLSAGAGQWIFPATAQGSPLAGVVEGSAGLRLRFGHFDGLSPFVDLQGGVVATGAQILPSVSATAGLEHGLGDAVSVGGFVRYFHVFAPASLASGDAPMVSAGLSVTLRLPTRGR